MNTKFPIFYAPEGSTTGVIEAPGVSVPEIAAAGSGPSIETVQIQSGGIEKIVPDDAPEFGVKGPKEILGEDPEETLDKADQAMGKPARERGPDGKFLPKSGKQTEAKPNKNDVNPVVSKPVAKPVQPVAAVPAKVKIGDDEKTPEEWQQELASLREKATAAAKPPEPKPDPKAREAEASKTAEQLKVDRQKFIETEVSKQDEFDEKMHDTILSGGPEGLKAHRTLLAKTEAKLREWAADSINSVIDDLKGQLKPILDREKTIGQYSEENGVLNDNPDLKAHPKGLETYRVAKEQYESYFDTVQAKGEQATPQEKAWAAQYGALSPADRKQAIIANAKAEVAKIPLKTNGNGAPVKVAPRVTTPQRNDRPGGGVAVQRMETADAKALREMEARGF